MAAFIILAAVGAAVVLLGIKLVKGDINAVQWYHRQRVAEENQAAFGKLMGSGTISCGAGCILFGALSAVAESTAHAIWMTAGIYSTIVCLAVGIGLFIYATIRYNHGVF